MPTNSASVSVTLTKAERRNFEILALKLQMTEQDLLWAAIDHVMQSADDELFALDLATSAEIRNMQGHAHNWKSDVDVAFDKRHFKMAM